MDMVIAVDSPEMWCGGVAEVSLKPCQFQGVVGLQCVPRNEIRQRISLVDLDGPSASASKPQFGGLLTFFINCSLPWPYHYQEHRL
jgi:hypothetical protein